LTCRSETPLLHRRDSASVFDFPRDARAPNPKFPVGGAGRQGGADQVWQEVISLYREFREIEHELKELNHDLDEAKATAPHIMAALLRDKDTAGRIAALNARIDKHQLDWYKLKNSQSVVDTNPNNTQSEICRRCRLTRRSACGG